LTGPPGNGKSSFIALLAAELHVPIHLISLSNSKLQDADLAERVNGPAGSRRRIHLFVLEDIDRIQFTNKKDAVAEKDVEDDSTGNITNTKQHASVTLSGLLNVLDGHSAPENALIIMTANDPTKLDPALRRPGRIDRTYEFTVPTEAMIDRYYDAVALGQTSLSRAEFVAMIREDKETKCMARVQELARRYLLLELNVISAYQ